MNNGIIPLSSPFNLLTLALGAWLSFPDDFFCYCCLVLGVFLFFYELMNNVITQLPLLFNFFTLVFRGLIVISNDFLSLLFSPRDIFSFVQIKKRADVCLASVSRSAVFERHMPLNLVVEIITLLHH